MEKIDYSGMVELGAEDEEEFRDWMSQQMCQVRIMRTHSARDRHPSKREEDVTRLLRLLYVN